MSQPMIKTSFLLSNLHCPSCVSTIKDVLFNLVPAPFSVSPSLVSSWVTVEHGSSLSVIDIRDAFEQAGFDICDMDTTSSQVSLKSYRSTSGDVGYLDHMLERLPVGAAEVPAKSKYPARHIQNCEACRLGGNGQHDLDHLQVTGTTKPLHLTTTPHSDGVNSKMGSKKDQPEISVIIDNKPHTTFKASVAIGGMTCAACVGTLTRGLEKKDWVEKAVVNLISNSATIEFTGEEHKSDIIEVIEDIGYDAVIDSIVSLRDGESAPATTARSIEILIEGMFCEHCPGKVMNSLRVYGDRVTIEHPLDLHNAILKIKYMPDAPTFTIRNILETISTAEPAFAISIYHPPTLEERSRRMHTREQIRILLRAGLTIIAAIPTFIIGIVYMSLVPQNNAVRMFLMSPLIAGISRAQWALLIMATPVYFFCADVFHVRALKEVRSMWRHGSPTPFLKRFYRFGSMNMLMSLGTTIAYVSSLAQLISAGVRKSTKVDNAEFYFDSVIFLTLFLLIGRFIESYSKSKTGDAVTMLGKLRPTEAILVTQTAEDTDTTSKIAAKNQPSAKVAVDLLEFGDLVRILHGASPPCDGTIVEGTAQFDESSLTGESKLVKKQVDSQVFSGTVNKGQSVVIRITGVAGSSMLDQIVKAVREGQTKRAPMEMIADSLTSYFVPFVTLIAITTWVVWLSLGKSGTLPLSYLNGSAGWVAWSLQFAIAVFVVACPCGLALAAPTALFVGGGLAAQYGILAKGGGEAFEKASKLDCIVFDKTGTLTLGGEPVVTNHALFTFESLDQQQVEESSKILAVVSEIEQNSSHPIAKALVSFCAENNPGTSNFKADNVEEIAGKGMEGTFLVKGGADIHMIVGNELLMADNNVEITEKQRLMLNTWKIEGKSVALAAMMVQISGTPKWMLSAIFSISDPIRPEATSIIKALRERGTDVWMLSGDNQMTANAIGSQVGIPASNIIAGVLPSQKADKIQYLQKSLKARTASGSEQTEKRAVVAMVGDGINDSPALTVADVGIAIGSGSDIAISSAEFVLVSSNLASLITLLDLSKAIFRRVKLNFGWALVYNMIALPVAAGVLYPVVSHGKHVKLDPVWASLAMAASSISVVCSSLALRVKLPFIGFRAKTVVIEQEK